MYPLSSILETRAYSACYSHFAVVTDRDVPVTLHVHVRNIAAVLKPPRSSSGSSLSLPQKKVVIGMCQPI